MMELSIVIVDSNIKSFTDDRIDAAKIGTNSIFYEAIVATIKRKSNCNEN